MPKSFEISASSHHYHVAIGKDLLASAIGSWGDAIILIDEHLSHVLPADTPKVVYIAATEENKSLENLVAIVAKLRELGAKRNTEVIAIGGGIIQDIATFVTSIYMRGIIWNYLPTTLLAMVDSCVGGKSSINVHGYKNLVGNFHPPTRVVIDLSFLTSLDVEQLVGGLCEAVKICYAHSIEMFETYLTNAPSISMTELQAELIVKQSLQAKKWFVEADEFDQRERLLLNFGHTFGHALEAGTGFKITHGVAVGVGMIVAEEYAKQQSLLRSIGIKNCSRLTAHVAGLLKELPQLGSKLRSLDIEDIVEKFDNDKKHRAEQYRVVLPIEDGRLKLVEISNKNKCRADIRNAYQAAINRLNHCE